MFKRLSGLQWICFWFASVLVYSFVTRHIPIDMEIEEAGVLGKFFWAGLIVVGVTWLVKLIIRQIKNSKIKKPIEVAHETSK